MQVMILVRAVSLECWRHAGAHGRLEVLGSGENVDC